MGESGGLVVFDSERISTGESSVLIGETTNLSKNYSEMIRTYLNIMLQASRRSVCSPPS
jgi:hypothetical protein